MSRPAGCMKELTGRDPLRSPGRPGVAARDDRVVFWLAVVDGFTTIVVAELAGVSEPVGVRWLGDGGAMPTVSLAPLTVRYPSFAEREAIALLIVQGFGVRDIARRLGRSPSTISRELRRNVATRGDKLDYRATVAQWKAEMLARRPKVAKLAVNDRLREYLQVRSRGQSVVLIGRARDRRRRRQRSGISRGARTDAGQQR